MKNWFVTHFSFSRKEIQGIAFLTFIVVILWLLPFVYQLVAAKEVDPELVSRKQEIMNFAERNRESQKLVSESAALLTEDPAYFPFDPNTLSTGEGKLLGLSDAQIRMIHNYVKKGGRFYEKDDFAKIYAITKEDYQRLAPHIRIQPTVANGLNRTNLNRTNQHIKPDNQVDTNTITSKRSFGKKPQKEVMINLNKTDSIELLDLYGIGPSFASRMIKYRDLLGGYYHTDQLLEVYGMDTERFVGFQKNVFVDPEEIQMIQINFIGYRELFKHPYITPRQANTIVQYRIQHGNYQKATDLLKIEILDEEFLRKIAPYLSFEEDLSNHADNREGATDSHP